MTTILAVERVYEMVKERFAVEAPSVNVVFGWRKPAQQLTQSLTTGRANRIVFVPGDDESAGEYLDARYPGKLSRALRTMLETCTVYVWASDRSTAQTAADPLAQWRACRLLLDATVRACDLALRELAGLHDQKPFSKAKWVLPNNEQPFGAELRFVLTLMSTVPDELPDLSGPTRVEVDNQQITMGYEIAPDEISPGEIDPPSVTLTPEV